MGDSSNSDTAQLGEQAANATNLGLLTSLLGNQYTVNHLNSLTVTKLEAAKRRALSRQKEEEAQKEAEAQLKAAQEEEAKKQEAAQQEAALSAILSKAGDNKGQLKKADFDAIIALANLSPEALASLNAASLEELGAMASALLESDNKSGSGNNDGNENDREDETDDATLADDGAWFHSARRSSPNLSLANGSGENDEDDSDESSQDIILDMSSSMGTGSTLTPSGGGKDEEDDDQDSGSGDNNEQGINQNFLASRDGNDQDDDENSDEENTSSENDGQTASDQSQEENTEEAGWLEKLKSAISKAADESGEGNATLSNATSES